MDRTKIDDAKVRDEIERLTGEAPLALQRLPGGDIGRSWRVRLRSGESLFAKSYAAHPEGGAMVAAEARGLTWLGDAGSLRVPRVRGASAPGTSKSPLLVLEWIEPADADARTAERLGRGLAALHRAGAPGFGFARDGFLGSLPQSNRSHPSWPAFFGAERLQPLRERARREGRLASGLDASIGRLIAQLPERVGDDEPPSRLHGDLWGGNWLCGAHGEPVLIDPAAYGGHREVDLAMMKLFGGFSQRVFDAYSEVCPLSPGHEERVPLYQLLPLLVHLVLFGRGYASAVERALEACGEAP